MTPRVTLILVLLLVVLGGGALLYQQQERTRRPEAADTLGRHLLADLKVAEIAALRIIEPERTLTIRHKGEGWTIAERADFPADSAKVREFVLQSYGLKVGQSDPIGEKDRARLNLDESGTRVEFADADGKALAALILGRKYFRRDVDDPKNARADGRFVAMPAEPQRAYLVADPLTQATTDSGAWIDRTSFQVERVRSLEVRFPDGGGWRIARDGDNAEWRMAGARAGEKIDVARANSASYSLSLLELADVAPPDAKDTGLDKPIRIDATTLDGLAYSILVGRLEGNNYYVRFTSSGKLVKDEKEAERLQRLEERLPREKLLSEYVLLIPQSKLEDTLRKRDELIEKPEEPRK